MKARVFVYSLAALLTLAACANNDYNPADPDDNLVEF